MDEVVVVRWVSFNEEGDQGYLKTLNIEEAVGKYM